MANFFSTCEKVRNLNLIEKTPTKNKTCGRTHPHTLNNSDESFTKKHLQSYHKWGTGGW